MFRKKQRNLPQHLGLTIYFFNSLQSITAFNYWLLISAGLSHCCLAKYRTNSETVIQRFSAVSFSFSHSSSVMRTRSSRSLVCLDICCGILYICCTINCSDVCSLQTTKHLREQALIVNLITRRSGVISHIYYEYNLLRDQLCHAGRTLRLQHEEGA